jgi:CRISPR-associated protein Csm3
MEKLLKKYVVKGTLTAKTGLRIGGSSNAMSIGGIDNTVIRNPLSNEPYIPGSSIKGKMRSLLVLAYGHINTDTSFEKKKEFGFDMQDDRLISSRLFGMATNTKKRFSRLIVRDAEIDADSVDLEKTELPYTEVKYENTINRLTAEANPRAVERVPAGAKFHFEMVLNIMEGDKVFDNSDTSYETEEKRLVGNMFYALRLLQDDYLGGYGSRGSGQVEFAINSVFVRTMDYYKSTQKSTNEDVKSTDAIVSPYMQFFTTSVTTA